MYYTLDLIQSFIVIMHDVVIQVSITINVFRLGDLRRNVYDENHEVDIEDLRQELIDRNITDGASMRFRIIAGSVIDQTMIKK